MTELNYTRLVKMGQTLLKHDRLGWTMDANDLVHEMYLRLATWREQVWATQGQFMRAAEVVMRHVLTDQSRKRDSWKGGKNVQFVAIAL